MCWLVTLAGRDTSEHSSEPIVILDLEIYFRSTLWRLTDGSKINSLVLEKEGDTLG